MIDKVHTIKSTSSLISDVSKIEDERPPHVLICVHGIRDDGAWCDIAAIAPGRFLDTTIEIACVRYDRLSIRGFVWGHRRAAIQDDVIDQIDFIKKRFPDSQYSALCHSNGTKVMAEILPRLTIKLEWIFLCGSVCRLNDVKSLRNVINNPVNDAGTKDWWPIIAEILRPSMFQATGVNGFRCFPVEDRFFDYDHGEAVRKKHIEEWIFPTLAMGHVETSDKIDTGYKKHLPIYARRTLMATPIWYPVTAWMLWPWLPSYIALVSPPFLAALGLCLLLRFM
jgi:hypothetical protein